MRRTLPVFLIFVLVLGSAVFMWTRTIPRKPEKKLFPLRFANETTYALGPMHPDGKRLDYFQAIERSYHPPEMKTEENGYRMIVRGCGFIEIDNYFKYDEETTHTKRMDADNETLRLQAYEKLGLDPNELPEIGKIESPDNFLSRMQKSLGEVEFEDSLYYKYHNIGYENRTKTFDVFPELNDWHEENTVGLDLLGEAVRKPFFLVPFIRVGEDVTSPNVEVQNEILQQFRDFSRAIVERANHRIGKGNIDGAIYDILSCLYLGRHLRRSDSTAFIVTGAAIEGTALSVGINDNPACPPSREQLEYFLDELEKLSPAKNVSETLELERYLALAKVQDIYYGKISVLNLIMRESLIEEAETNWEISPEMRKAEQLIMREDVNFFLAETNRQFDDAVEKLTSYEALEPEMTKPYRESEPEITIPLIVTDCLIPDLQAYVNACKRLECEMNLHRLGLALLLYEKIHGSLPEDDWRTAILPYLGADPEKFFHCPGMRSKPDETVYAMIERTSDEPKNPNSLLLVEVFNPIKRDEGNGRIAKEYVYFGKSSKTEIPSDFKGLGCRHIGGTLVSFYGGKTRFISMAISEEELEKIK